MRKHPAAISVGSAMTIFHIAFVVIPVLSSKGVGEGQGWAVLLLDFPIAALVGLFSGWSFLGKHFVLYALLFCGGGTIMYAVVGTLLGRFIDRIRANAA